MPSGMPARPVEQQDDDPVAAGAGRAGEAHEHHLVEPLVDAVREVPDGLAARRHHEGSDVEPFEAVVAERRRPLAHRRPDPAPHWLQAEPVLVRRPELDREAGDCQEFRLRAGG